MLFRSLILYPFLAVVAAALIWRSLDYAPAPFAPAPQAGAAQGAERVFGPAALAAIAPAPNQETFVARTEARVPTGLRLAIRKGEGALKPDEAGARLLLTPEAGAGLAGAPIELVVTIRPMLYPTAPDLAAALVEQGGRATAWVSRPTATADGRVVFAFPAPAGALEAIALRPVNTADGDAAAVEIAELRLRRAGG